MSPTAFASLGPSAYWYLARGTGAVALILLTLSVILGVLGSLRFAAPPRWPRFAIDALHRDASLLVLAVLVIHIVTSVLDGFAPIKLLDAVIPFDSRYRPLWLGLGALSFDVLIALTITSLLRRRLGYGAWRAIHWLAYASWPVAVLHGLGTGSDVKVWWMLALTAACVAAVVVAVWIRIFKAQPEIAGGRPAAFVLSISALIALAAFALLGPLQRGWARRAGTPTTLLAAHATAAGPSPAGASRASAGQQRGVTAATSPVQRSFSARLTGTLTQHLVANGAILDLALRMTGGMQGRLRVRLAGAPLPGGGLSMTGSQVDLAPAGAPSVLEGRIVALQGQRFVARVSEHGRAGVELRANMSIDGGGGVLGTLSGTPQGAP